MAIEYPPYVTGYGGIPTLFKKIKEAAVPAKFTQDFLNTILGLKSSSFRPMIPLLKKLGFIDPANAPTQAYRDVREDGLKGPVIGERLREAYKSLFQRERICLQTGEERTHLQVAKHTWGSGRRWYRAVCSRDIYGIG